MKITLINIIVILLSLVFISVTGFLAFDYLNERNRKTDVAIPFCEFNDNKYFKPNKTLGTYEVGINITTYADNKFMSQCCVVYDNTSKYYVLLDCPLGSNCFNRTCTLEESK